MISAQKVIKVIPAHVFMLLGLLHIHQSDSLTPSQSTNSQRYVILNDKH
jgi:hypothetical protein